jgi:two-component sensor histidine kinase
MREVALHIESNVNAPRVSRSHLAPLRPSLGPRYDDVVLVVSELVTNSVRHSQSVGIDVTIRSIDGRIRVEVSDDGPGFTQDSPRGEGLGLMLVEKLSDRWGLTSADQFTVWAELGRDPV